MMNYLKGVFKLFAVCYLLSDFCGGQAQNDPPSQSVMVMVGDDAVLPCKLEPPMNAVSMTIEWGRPDLSPRFVFVWHQGQELVVDQNEAYKKRTSLSINKLKHGDLSLMLIKVKISDDGIYRCFIPKQGKEYFVQLIVGAASSPGISLAGINKVNSGVMLDCESNGWHPQPEVMWLDGDGKVLTAGRTETVRDPDGLYMVSRRVTVEKRNSNSFTCRVHQENINQTQETHIHVPDDFFMVPSDCATSTAFSVLFSLLFIVAVGLMLWIWRRYKTEVKMRSSNIEEKEKLMMESNKIKDSKKEILKEELQKKEEEQRNRTQVIETLRSVAQDLNKQKGQITSQIEGSEKLAEETELKVRKVDKEVTEKGGDKTANKAQGYLKFKEILQETSWKQEERRKELQQLLINTEELMKKPLDHANKISEEKNRVESNIKEIKRQIEETENQRGEGKSEKGGGIEENKAEQIS